MSILFLQFLQVELPSEQVGVSASINSFLLNINFVSGSLCGKVYRNLKHVPIMTSHGEFVWVKHDLHENWY